MPHDRHPKPHDTMGGRGGDRAWGGPPTAARSFAGPFARAGALAGTIAAACAAGIAAPGPASADDLFVTTTTYEITGSCSVMAMEPPFSVQLDLYTIHSDAVARRFGNYVFVVNRQPANNILVLDAANSYGLVKQYSTGAGSDPTDIEVVAADKAYIPLYNTTLLSIVEPLTGAVLGSIDLSRFADADGLPEIDQVAVVGGRAFVSFQRLDRPGGWLPAGGSGLAVIDVASDALIDADPATSELDPIRLQLQNPFWDLTYDRSLHRLIAVCPGSFLALDGGIEAIDPFTLRSDRVLITEQALGGELDGAAIVSPTLGYAIISDSSFNTCLVRFDPSTGTRLDTVMCSSGFWLSDLEVSDAGRVYVGDRTPSAPGIRIFQALTAQPLVQSPVDVGLPPFDMVLLESVPTATSALELAPARLRLAAHPNPFNPSVTIELRAEAGAARAPGAARATGAALPPLRIVDARGRLVATLAPSGAPVGDNGGPAAGEDVVALVYHWNGTNGDGIPVASGCYRAILEDGSTPAIPLLLLR
jgi:hypothetical protein